KFARRQAVSANGKQASWGSELRRTKPSGCAFLIWGTHQPLREYQSCLPFIPLKSLFRPRTGQKQGKRQVSLRLISRTENTFAMGQPHYIGTVCETSHNLLG